MLHLLPPRQNSEITSPSTRMALPFAADNFTNFFDVVLSTPRARRKPHDPPPTVSRFHWFSTSNVECHLILHAVDLPLPIDPCVCFLLALNVVRHLILRQLTAPAICSAPISSHKCRLVLHCCLVRPSICLFCIELTASIISIWINVTPPLGIFCIIRSPSVRQLVMHQKYWARHRVLIQVYGVCQHAPAKKNQHPAACSASSCLNLLARCVATRLARSLQRFPPSSFRLLPLAQHLPSSPVSKTTSSPPPPLTSQHDPALCPTPLESPTFSLKTPRACASGISWVSSLCDLPAAFLPPPLPDLPPLLPLLLPCAIPPSRPLPSPFALPAKWPPMCHKVEYL